MTFTGGLQPFHRSVQFAHADVKNCVNFLISRKRAPAARSCVHVCCHLPDDTSLPVSVRANHSRWLVRGGAFTFTSGLHWLSREAAFRTNKLKKKGRKKTPNKDRGRQVMAFKYPAARRDESQVSVKLCRAPFSLFVKLSGAGKATPGRESRVWGVGGAERQITNGRRSKNKTLLRGGLLRKVINRLLCSIRKCCDFS